MESNVKMVRWVVWSGLFLVILAICFAFVREQRTSISTSNYPDSINRDTLPIISRLSDFELTNQLSEPIGLADFAGVRWCLLYSLLHFALGALRGKFRSPSARLALHRP